MAKTNKQLQAEIDKLTIEKNNLVDMLEISEKGIRGVSKLIGLDGISETTYFNDADIDCIIKTVEKLKADKKDLHKKLMEGLNCNNEKVEKIRELEDKVDEQFKVITKYEKELEEQDKEIEELKEENHDLDTMVINMKERIKELEKENKRLKDKKDNWRLEHYNEMVMKCKKLEEKYEQCFEELSTKLSEESDLDIIRAENKVIKQDKANLLAELTRQINEKQELRNKNRKLTKRRREGRYNPKKVYEKLARGRLCYIPEGDYLPTKVHESLIDAMEEGHRLADRTGNQVYIVGTYCKI